MDVKTARRVIDSLRIGIPPDGYISHFTVGRTTQINSVVEHLNNGARGALLLQANYGSGKSHLLKYIRELALENMCAISFISVDSRSGVRFNRMDQILGAICRRIETPDGYDKSIIGIRNFFDHIADYYINGYYNGRDANFWQRLSNEHEWNYSDILESPAMYIAIRSWIKGGNDTQDLIADWLMNPPQYKTRRKLLYTQLVYRLQASFRDVRSERQFYTNNIFDFHYNDYAQCWAALRDIHKLAVASGLKGLMILFDEYEDVITNLRNIAYQEVAFRNLFKFYSGEEFPSFTCYAVTPEFATKCKKLLHDRNRWDFDCSEFENIPTFQISPLAEKDMVNLAYKITNTHSIAYEWDAANAPDYNNIKNIVSSSASHAVQDRVRQTIKAIVGFLDDLCEDSQ